MHEARRRNANGRSGLHLDQPRLCDGFGLYEAGHSSNGTKSPKPDPASCGRAVVPGSLRGVARSRTGDAKRATPDTRGTAV